MSDTGIKKHMDVIGADGIHVGTVDGVETLKALVDRREA